MAKVFLSYAHADEAYKNELVNHLAPLKRRGVISEWHDRRLLPGAPLDATIAAELEAADLILMLISADFVASDYCWDKEMARALKRHEAGEARAISILCRPCLFEDLPFARFVMTPTDAKAISTWTNRDDAWVDVVTAIRRAIETGPLRRPAPAQPAEVVDLEVTDTHATEPHVGRRPTLPRVVTDLDSDRFFEQCRRDIPLYFRKELDMLEMRDPAWKGVFEPIDATQFAARVYLNGQEIATCHVFSNAHHMRRTIFYSQHFQPGQNGWNESLTVKSDSGGPFLEPMGITIGFRQQFSSRMEPFDAASYLFDMLMNQARSRIR